MTKKILLTSFVPWLPHHKSNASDDLLEVIENMGKPEIRLLRKLPVEVEAASKKAIATFETYQPDVIIACGMAESRKQLTIESNATKQNHQLKTKVNLEKLVSKLSETTISHDAGKFVCEGLYYHLLKHIESSQLETECIFVHVPILTQDNLSSIVQDFLLIIDYLTD